MALQWVDTDLPLSLDDFIPRHLQRGPSQDHNEHTESSAENGVFYKAKATMVFTNDDEVDNTSPRVERRWIRYDGIGPTDEDGMPFASRSSVDKPRQWYKNMFRILHQMSDSEDSDSEEVSKLPDHQTESLNVPNKSSRRFLTDVENDQSKLEDQSRSRSQEPKNLQITFKSTIKESPSKTITTYNTQTSPNPSFTKPRSTTLPRHSSSQPAERQLSPRFSSEGPQFTISSNKAHSPNSSTSQSIRTRTNHSHTYQEKTKPAPLPLVSDRSFHSSKVSDSTPVVSRPANKDTPSTQSINKKDKYSSLGSTTTATSTSHRTSRESKRSSSKILEALETELRQFTDELDKDLEACTQRSETTMEQCEELLVRRSSYRAGGSPETNNNRKKLSKYNTEEEAVSPIAKAVLKFDFVAESEKELSLQRGTTVNILKNVDKNWLLGEQDGRRGLFPASYARVLSPGESEPADTPLLSAIALYDFKADSAAELPLRKGQHVLITKRVDGSWFEGRVEGSGRLGLFPASYVQIKEGRLQERKGISKIRGASDTNSVEQDSARITLTEKPITVKASASSKLQKLAGSLYRVVYSFSPKNPDELQLNVGDIVTVTQRCEDGWYVGVCWRTKKFGSFPGNFVAPYVTLENTPS
ncbi:vinexin isoform X2 [Mixophyes fleayi]|uniref:vinexin isoform X2 n=1 Tax=Mixophyes fleayi TaxID=3061075 RepID=UPI003F4DB1AC